MKISVQNGQIITSSQNDELLSAYQELAKKKGIKLPEPEKPKTSFLSKVVDVLRTGEYAVGGLLTGKGITGGIKEKISPSQALGISTKETPLLSGRGLVGLAADIILDPTTYLTFGAGGAIKAITKGGKIVPLSKIGEKALITSVKELGEGAGRKKMAELLAEKGGEKYLAKTGLKFMGQEIVPRQVFTKTGDIIDTAITKTPYAGKAYTATKETLKGLFSPFSEMQKIEKGEKYVGGFKKYIKSTRSEMWESSEEVGKMAAESQKIIGKTGGERITDLIETGGKIDQKPFATTIKNIEKPIKLSYTAEKKVKEIADYFSTGHKEMAKTEKELGLLKTELDDYVRRKITKEGLDYVNAGGDLSMFSKPIRSKLGAAKERKTAEYTIKEFNNLMRDKLGGKNFFEPDAFKAFAYRKAESIKAVNTDRFLKWVGAEFGEKAPKIENGIKWIESSAPQLKGQFLPAPIARHIDETYKFLTNDESTNAFIRAYDKLLNFWKGSVTGYFPAFHTRNALGGVFNNWLAGVSDPNTYKIGNDILKGKQGVLKTKIGDISYDAIRQELKQYGVIGQPGYLDIDKTIDDFLNTSITGKIKQLPRGAMEMVENNVRTPLYISRRMAGENPEVALGAVLKYHFDYMPEGLTFFEKNIMKRIVPFYRWTRGNIPLQIENLIKQPGKYSNLIKTINRLDGEQDEAELAILPDYMKEGMPIKIPDSIAKIFGGETKLGFANYIYGLGIPAEDINKLWRGGARRTIEGLMSETSPILKYPIEAITGRNLFFGSQIDDFNKAPTFLKDAPEPFKEWIGFAKIEYKDKQGNKRIKYTAEPRKLHALQTALARGWITVDKLTDDNYTNALKVGYALMNLKVKSVDLEYQEYLNHKKITDEVAKELQRKGVLLKFEKYYEPKK
ncbi:MAG TPA: hypothetical protein DHV62_09655 [Elusimicrobia bacterium]|nr:hypothetical protein [Elusimicrobiota bacterium]